MRNIQRYLSIFSKHELLDNSSFIKAEKVCKIGKYWPTIAKYNPQKIPQCSICNKRRGKNVTSEYPVEVAR